MKTRKLVSIVSAIALSTVLIVAGTYTSSSGFVKSLATKNRITSVLAYNAAGADRFLQLFDAASLPVNGSVPLIEVRIPTQSTASLDFGATLAPVSGFVAVISTSDTTLTLTGGNDALILFIYP